MEILSFSLAAILLILVSICSTHGESFLRPESRIIGGEFTEAGEFPHQVMMLVPVGPPRNGLQEHKLCGGSILDKLHILLAGHCVTYSKYYNLQILVGLTDFSKRRSWNEVYAEDIIIHPCYNQYSPQNGALHYNDIAIIKLNQPLSPNGKTIKAIQIDENDLAQDGLETMAIGWGKTHPTDPDGGMSNILKKVKLNVTTTECKEDEDLVPNLNTDAQICTENTAEYVCQGDSGGPLLCDDGSGTNTNVVCGISSLAFTTDPNHIPCLGPSVFTRVYHYRKWINDILAGDDESVEGCIGSIFQPTGAPEIEYPETEPEPKPESGIQNQNP